jgi:hypothetical protein
MALVLSACAQTNSGDTPATESAPVNTALPAGCAGLERTVLTFEPDRDGLRTAVGAADSVVAQPVPNRHSPGVMDTLFTLRYPGLIVEIHTVGGGGDLASGVDVQDNRYIAFPRIGIGAYADSVVAFLGAPTEKRGPSLVYDCGEEVNQPVTFEVVDGRVRRILISYYVD